MHNNRIERLAKLDGTPAVSIYCPLDVRRPGNDQDPAVLAGLRERAADRVRELTPEPVARQVISKLDDAIATVDLRHPTPGVAVFVSPDTADVITLESAGDAQVAVGPRFALLHLVTAQQRLPFARVLVLSQARTRCIDITGPRATERRDFGFPVTIVAPTEADTPHRDFPLGEHETDEAVKFVLRAVDAALTPLHHRDPRPLAVLGAERDLAYFDQIKSAQFSVIGRLAGNYERDTVDEIAGRARPLLDTHRNAGVDRACEEVRDALGSHAVAGVADVWDAARSGRGRRLVVEEGYAASARIAGDAAVVAGDGTGTIDAVEDVVVEVLRHGGEVVVARPGDLQDLGHVALLTRYS
jgi:Bacterial archaeo-eukaryotic release factor family 3